MPVTLRFPGNGLTVSSQVDSVVPLLCMSPRKTQIKAHHETTVEDSVEVP